MAMQQHITKEQLNELSEKGKEKLREWWNPNQGDSYYVRLDNVDYERVFCSDNEHFWQHYNESRVALPLLSIGQMIEFLDEHFEVIIIERHVMFYWSENNQPTKGAARLFTILTAPIKLSEKKTIAKPTEELCDALWEAVKEVLEK